MIYQSIQVLTWARRRTTTLIKTNALPLSRATNFHHIWARVWCVQYACSFV